jgi:hypothetical protein
MVYRAWSVPVLLQRSVLPDLTCLTVGGMLPMTIVAARQTSMLGMGGRQSGSGYGRVGGRRCSSEVQWRKTVGEDFDRAWSLMCSGTMNALAGIQGALEVKGRLRCGQNRRTIRFGKARVGELKI